MKSVYSLGLRLETISASDALLFLRLVLELDDDLDQRASGKPSRLGKAVQMRSCVFYHFTASCEDTLHLTPMFGAPKESSFLGGAEHNDRAELLARLDLVRVECRVLVKSSDPEPRVPRPVHFPEY
jgi:hypothetical protein